MKPNLDFFVLNLVKDKSVVSKSVPGNRIKIYMRGQEAILDSPLS